MNKDEIAAKIQADQDQLQADEAALEAAGALAEPPTAPMPAPDPSPTSQAQPGPASDSAEDLAAWANTLTAAANSPDLRAAAAEACRIASCAYSQIGFQAGAVYYSTLGYNLLNPSQEN